MVSEFLFVSCDIVAHSAEPSLQVQLERVRDINNIVASQLCSHAGTGAVWASGGDGGHVALPNPADSIGCAVELIAALRQWSIQKNVRLRVCGCTGDVDEIVGADGRRQLVGPGINAAGRLLPYGGSQRVVVTEAFRALALRGDSSGVSFHDDVRIEPRSSPPIDVCLLSFANGARSSWDQGESDRHLLERALVAGNALEVIYRARRLLELNSEDVQAIEALRGLGTMSFRNQHNFVQKLIQNEHVGPELIRLGNVIERRAGERLCSHGDGGASMFLVLKGCVQVLLPPDDSKVGPAPREKSITMIPGQIGGHLAFALRRNRTATLSCLEDTALLGFTYDELLQSFASSPDRARHVQDNLAREIHATVLENLYNTAPIFDEIRPLVKDRSPWLTMLNFSTLATVPRTVVRHSVPAPGAAGTGITFLVSGTMQEDAQTSPISGNGYPVVHASLPEYAASHAKQWLLTDDCQLLHIEPAGLWRLGREAFDAIARQIESSSRPSSGTPATAIAVTHARELIFLSYSRTDHELVTRLHEQLVAAGHKVWWDQDILPGQDWKHEIRQAMKRSSAMLCCLSADLMQRRKSGVYPELVDAIGSYREQRPGSIFLVPVRLSECEIPSVEIDDTRTLDRLQFVDLFPTSQWQRGFDRLVAALRRQRADL